MNSFMIVLAALAGAALGWALFLRPLSKRYGQETPTSKAILPILLTIILTLGAAFLWDSYGPKF